jgi:hypothetical protein
MISKWIFVVFITLIISCSSPKVSGVDELVLEKLATIDKGILNSGLNVIIIPGEGCGGCISQIMAI